MDNRAENHMDNSMYKHLSGDELCDFAEGILADSARGLAEKHLESCEACRRELSITGAYFKAVGNLEPVPAPANFLAKVRARLEKPSPWQAFWARFANPWRFVPAQLAVLTILGITILASYMYQNGGMGPSSIAQLPSKTDSPIVPETVETPVIPAPSKLKEVDRLSDQEGARAKSAKPRASSEAEAKSESMESPQDLGAGLQQESIAKSKALEKSYGRERAEEKLNKDAIAVNPQMGGTAAPAMSAPPSSVATRELSAPKSANPSKKSGASKADQDQSMPEIVLQLRNAKDTTAILSGLKAMGIEVISENRKSPFDLVLKLSPSAIPEVIGYLEGYGKTEGRAKPLPESASLILVSLRIILSAPLPTQK